MILKWIHAVTQHPSDNILELQGSSENHNIQVIITWNYKGQAKTALNCTVKWLQPLLKWLKAKTAASSDRSHRNPCQVKIRQGQVTSSDIDQQRDVSTLSSENKEGSSDFDQQRDVLTLSSENKTGSSDLKWYWPTTWRLNSVKRKQGGVKWLQVNRPTTWRPNSKEQFLYLSSEYNEASSDSTSNVTP